MDSHDIPVRTDNMIGHSVLLAGKLTYSSVEGMEHILEVSHTVRVWGAWVRSQLLMQSGKSLINHC